MKRSRPKSEQLSPAITTAGQSDPSRSPPADDSGLDKLIAEISARMVKATAETLDEDIQRSLIDVMTFCRVDRCGLMALDEASLRLIISHAWQNPKVPQLPIGTELAVLYPWSFQRLLIDRETVALNSIEDLPPEAFVDRQSHRQRSTQSSLVIPLFIGQKIYHMFGMGTVRERRVWSQDFIRRMRLLGEIFVSALMRREMEQSLRQTKERLDLAADAAEAVFWELDLESGELWANDKAFDLFGFDLKTDMTLEKFLTKVHDDDHPLIHAAVEQSQHTGDELLVEYRSPDQNGRMRWMLSRGRFIRQQNPSRPFRLMGITMEITVRKQMEQRLLEQLREIEYLREQLEAENLYLRNEVEISQERRKWQGVSECMSAITVKAEQVAGTGSTVLVLGETGTGKELLAQTIHRLSPRAKRVMIKVNCAALPASLVESELFGREKGAFTGALSRQAGRFELADGSTLFLDEIAEMPLETQAKLLRVLQDGTFERLGSPQTIKVDVRVIAATNRDLAVEIAQGRFRRDLYYRLNVFPIHIPPLRERTDEIPTLTWQFVNELGERMGKKIRRIAASDMELMKAYSWPGNIRELRNVIEHAMIVSRGEVLELDRSVLYGRQSDSTATLESVERRHIQETLKHTGGKIKGAGGAAERLGLNPSTLYSRMRKLDIKFPRP